MQRLFDTVFIFFHNNNLWIEVSLVTICGKLEITMTKKKDPVSPVDIILHTAACHSN